MKIIFLLLSLLSFSSFGQEDEEMLNKLVEEKQKQTKAFQQIDQGAQAIQAAPSKLLNDLKSTSEKTFDLSSLTDPKMIESMKLLFIQSGFHSLPPEQVRYMILDKVKGKPTEKLFKKVPKLLDISVAVLLDRRAFLGLLDVMKRQEDLKIFFIISVALFLLSFVLKKMFLPKKSGLLRSFLTSLVVRSLTTVATFYIFYIMFKKEVGPLVEVVVNQF
jgi:hypothetical protein